MQPTLHILDSRQTHFFFFNMKTVYVTFISGVKNKMKVDQNQWSKMKGRAQIVHTQEM